METKGKIYGVLLVVSIVVGFPSCLGDDDIPEIINEEEVITTLALVLTADGMDSVILRSRDLDADGPNPPILTVDGNILANTVYNGGVSFLNETENPPNDITEEVREETEEHQVFYAVGNSLNVEITYTDADVDGNPVGLEFTFETGAAGSGTLTVTLIHEPDKNASGVSTGMIENAGGETDFTASFGIEVQ